MGTGTCAVLQYYGEYIAEGHIQSEPETTNLTAELRPRLLSESVKPVKSKVNTSRANPDFKYAHASACVAAELHLN